VKLVRLFLAVLIPLLLAACTTSPTGRSQLVMISEESAIAQSAWAYAQVMSGYAKKGQISYDQALINRVNLITGRLIYEALDTLAPRMMPYYEEQKPHPVYPL